MASTAISQSMDYKSSIITTYCGQVFCSQNFENFLINCAICSAEFNLLSCSLFMKHVKECLPFGQSYLNDLISDVGGLINRTGAEQQDNGHLNSLTDIEVEFVETKQEETEQVSEEDQQLTDYQDEDDIPIEKIARRKITEDIIDEYKRHRILWDINHSYFRKTRLRKQQYKRMIRQINSKFKLNMTAKELQEEIFRLKNEYRRELERKEKFEAKHQGDGLQQEKFISKLWFFNRLSFIQDVSDDAEIKDQEGTNVSDDDSSGSYTDGAVSKQTKAPKSERPESKMLSAPMITYELISQYKKYPLLWDQTAPLHNDKYARKDAIHKIGEYINKTFEKNVTDREIKRQILNLRCGYRRAQRKKHGEGYRVTLWYYDQISFIDRKSNGFEPVEPLIDIKTEHDVTRPTANGKDDPLNHPERHETENNWSLDDLESDRFDDNYNETQYTISHGNQEKERQIIQSLIKEYKHYPCLWDAHLYKTSDRFERQDAIISITSMLNAKLKTDFKTLEIRNKIVQLRSSYRRVLRKKEIFEKRHESEKRTFYPQLWYFNDMSFIGTKESDFFVSRPKKRKIKLEENHDQSGNLEANKTFEEGVNKTHLRDPDNSEIDDDTSDPTDIRDSNQLQLANNKELIKCIIEEYKKLPELWSTKCNKLKSRTLYVNLTKTINNKFKTNFSARELNREMIKLRNTYKRASCKIQKDPNFQSNIWYLDLLSFIDSNPDILTEHCNQPASCSDTPDNETAEEDNCQRKRRTQSKEHVSKIIELYKAAPVLWDKNHSQYNLRTVRKKAVDEIVSVLAKQHNCYLTVEEFRYQIRFLKISYFRALRHQATPEQRDSFAKPFFFDQMSFLEPLASDVPVTVHRPPMSAKLAPSEHITLLIENKPLMIDFIGLYKAQVCLWDRKHLDSNNPVAHEEAYTKIINMLKQHNLILTKEQVISAINFLHSTVVSPQKSSQATPIWFYEHLKFINKIPRTNTRYCSHCNQYFRTLSEYVKHKIEIDGDYPYKCSVCNAGFISRSKYAYHLITHKEPHKCNLCEFTAFDKHNYNVHMLRHKRIHAHKCQLCEKGFVTSTELRRHMRMHTGERPFICHICGKQLPANSEFRQHVKRHRNERDHKCDTCGMAFFTLKTLRDHMASHSSDRGHVCEVCGAAFKRRKTLNQHKALHLEKKHVCKICGKQFAQKAGIYSHMKSHGLITGTSCT